MNHRNTIYDEKAEIISHQAHPGDQFILKVRAPKCAMNARPGSFVHIQCDPLLPLRRPISIMRTDADEGYVELLYKNVGEGTRLLSEKKPGEVLPMLGPIGNAFHLNPECKRPLLIGGGVGIPPMIFIANAIRTSHPQWQAFVIMGSEVPFPFKPRPSQIMLPGIPDGVIGAVPLLEDWGIASRLASTQGYAGCYDGYVTGLAEEYLQVLSEEELNEVEIYSCGPHPMLKAVSDLARKYNLPCQVSLEEFMACAVGGCAGCVVEIETEHGPAMKRVCVDGPVFDARLVKNLN